MGATGEQLKKLSDESILDELEIHLKWFPQTTKGGYATCVSYFDARDIARILDHVLGPTNWSDSYHELKGNLFCRIEVKMEDGSVIYREDVGTESRMDKEKGEASDAFKRAATKLGIRFAYDVGNKQFPMAGDYIVLDDRNKIHKRDVKNLAAYCNGMNTQLGLLAQLWKSDSTQKPPAIINMFKELKEYYSV